MPTADVPTADVPTVDVPTADVPTAEVPTDDVIVVGDGASSGDVIPLSNNSIEEEQQSNSQSHYKYVSP